jgi:dihydrofolate synthase / folylpolyglutamate synthase
MTPSECLSYLGRIQGLGIKLGLENVRSLLAHLGDPHLTRPSLVVAGSNGKGSVCAMLARILSMQGFFIGLYTSPHLVEYEERIQMGGEPIPRRDFCRLLTRLRGEIDALLAKGRLAAHPTHFEILTCLAWMAFRETAVDLAILEVGMGGRFDAVNTAEPELCVITTVSLEHQKYLGETLAEIAAEKAGVIKAGIPVVSGARSDEAARVIRARARDLGAPLFEVPQPLKILNRDRGGIGMVFEHVHRGEKYRLTPSLAGGFQGDNAAVAATAAVELSRCWRALDKKSIVQGIASTRWEGRMETAARNPVILLDGAHNPEGAAALRDFIEESASRPVVLVLAAMRDKAIGGLTEILFPAVDGIVLTRFPYFRAADPEDIAASSPEFSDRIHLEPDPALALRRAVEDAGPSGTVVVAGSLFLVGEIKKVLSAPDEKRAAAPASADGKPRSGSG